LQRRTAVIFVALIDVAVFCLAVGAGHSLRTGNVVAFAPAVALQWLLEPRAMSAAQRPMRDWRVYLKLSLVALMAWSLRGGVLALLQRCGWPPQISIFLAVALGLAVTLPGFKYAASGAESSPNGFAFGLIAFAAALRVVYAGSVELLPEETYYWNYSQHLDWGYLDHPPMVAWLIKFGTALFGQTEFGVRFGALCCGAVASIFVYRLAQNLYGAAAALAALLLAQALPFFFLAGLLMTPDAPLTAAWAASLYFLERALIAEQRRAWLLAGIALGLGMISKYSIALLVAVSCAFMLWDAKARRWWRRPEPYVAALLAAAIFSPVIIWNAQHEWISFAFQTSRRLAEAPRFALHKLIASMLVILTPTGLLALIAAFAARSTGDEAIDAVRRRRWSALAILLPLAVFAAFSLRHEVKLDWTGTLLTAALPVLAWGMIAPREKLSRFAAWLKAAWPATLVAMLLIYGAGLHYLTLGIWGVGFGKHIELFPVGWRDLSTQVINTAAAYRAQNGSDALIVGMDRYAIASELAFYGSKQHPHLDTANSHLFGGMGLMYGLWMPPKRQEHKDLLLVAWDRADLEDKSVAAQVERLGPIEDQQLTRDGKLVRHYYLRLAYGYRSVADP
jgi:dolichol-phosphate mannosyltransferase